METGRGQTPTLDQGEGEPLAARKSVRPALVVSAPSLVEHTTFVRHLLVGLADESVSAAMICPPGFDLESEAPRPAAVLKHPLIDLPFMEAVGIRGLAARLEKFQPTILHCLCETRARATRQLADRLNLPYLLMVNSLGPALRRLPVSPLRCARIIVPSEAIHQAVSRALPQFAERVRQINIGTFVEPGAPCFPKSPGLPSFVVAYPLDRVADFANLLQAFRSLASEGREFVVAIMGVGPAERSVRRLVTGLGLSEIVTIVPILNPWRDAIVAGDFFVQPRPLRRFSVFRLEAMAAGTTVAACWGGVDDLIVPDQTAAVFEPESEASIRQTLARLLDDHDTARRLAITAQEHIRARYTVSRMIQSTLKTYLEAQGKPD